MTDERLISAIDRIERALARLESRGSGRPGGDPAMEALGQLQQRYDLLAERERRLRERTSAAMERLTAIIDQRKAG
ncbi:MULTISPECIES: hypothetical protein [Sphingomonadales]|nr:MULTISPECIES: hypothetical protein [Sphingomonas]MDX3883937.1 hypothetical protein [Sphingomonas sp.]PTD17254.1 hypothetical protein CV103_18910 [Sphingomonas fennica]